MPDDFHRAPSQAKESSPSILLIEDNLAEARLAQYAFADFAPDCQILIAGDTEQAWQILNKNEPLAAIFLDVLVNGQKSWTFLEEVRKDERWQYLPVIMFSGLADPLDVKKAYSHGATSYVKKPSDLGELTEVLKASYRFWCGAATFPRPENQLFNTGR